LKLDLDRRGKGVTERKRTKGERRLPQLEAMMVMIETGMPQVHTLDHLLGADQETGVREEIARCRRVDDHEVMEVDGMREGLSHH
jgi:hypothetical protein